MGAGILLLGLALVPLTKSRNVSVAVTSHGVVVFRRHGISGRTGRMIERMPAVDPRLIKVGAFMNKVQLGDRILWLSNRSDPLLHWMSSLLNSANR